MCYYLFCVFCVFLQYCWLGLLTCKNRPPYNLYCVGGDVKHCSINQGQQSKDERTDAFQL